MDKLQCPSCGALVPSHEGWAKAALVSLMPAPTVPGMATQLRCPQCQTVFTQWKGSQPGTWRGLLPVAILLAALLAVAVLVPA